ncbi:MAG: methyltransferase domain-containing protein [Candidatus Omnitrophica bacterium]|nr:methyltransferase domain-containing protein [Candidatus Omnitrophota bacterium]
MEIVNTGERILLNKETAFTVARHFCAYKLAGNYICGKSVLDFGCGEGYGSHYLAGLAKKVTAVDRDREIIAYASDKYQKDNIAFITFDSARLDSLGDKFDVICSFQVIEHISDTDAFLKNIANLLNPEGVFICSTLNKLDSSPHSDTPINKFHVREYLFSDFESMLKQYFRKVEIFGLKRGKTLNFYRRLKKIGVFRFLPDSINPVSRFYRKIKPDNFIIVKDKFDTAMDFIAVCEK